MANPRNYDGMHNNSQQGGFFGSTGVNQSFGVSAMHQQQQFAMQQRMMMMNNQFMGHQQAPPYGAMPQAPLANMPPVPGYTPEMAKEYKAKQEQLVAQQAQQYEKQRKQAEQAMKERQFKEQQKKLQQFGAAHGPKIDADSLIKNIMGPADTKHHKKKQEVPKPVESNGDDDFGDFLQGPTVPDTGQQLPNQSQDQSVMSNQSQGQTPMSNQLVNSKPSVPAEPDKKADLMSMMFECSDFSAPKDAKGFKKRVAVKDMAPQNTNKTVFKEARGARHWKSNTEDLSNIFIFPKSNPTPGDQQNCSFEDIASKLKWLSGEIPPPKLYMQVEEAGMRDGQLDTSLLYPIFLRSGLERDILKEIWSMCNKTQPGVLSPTELYLALALISIAQNKMDFRNPQILSRCLQAPIPNLGQGAESSSNATNSEGAVHPPVPQGDAVHPPVPQGGAAQQSELKASLPQSMGETPIDNSRLSGPPHGGQSHGDPAHGGLSGGSMIHKQSTHIYSSMLPNSFHAEQSNLDDDFDDFQQAPSIPSSFKKESVNKVSSDSLKYSMPSAMYGVMPDPVTTDPPSKIAGKLIGEEDIHSKFRAHIDSTIPSTNSPATLAEDDDFGAFKDAASSKETSQDLFFPEANSKIKSTLPVAVTPAETSTSSTSATLDPLSAIKALVQDKTLYKAKEDETADDEWADLRSASVEQANTPSVIEAQNQPWDSSTEQVNEASQGGGTNDWASFPSQTQKTSGNPPEPLDWGDMKVSSPTVEKPVDSPSKSPVRIQEPSRKSPARSQNQPNKRYDFFGQSVGSGSVASGSGMHPLDTCPPDLPDDFDDAYDDGFGSFHVSSSTYPAGGGISSLMTYSHDEDDDILSYSSKPNTLQPVIKDNIDNISTASSDFSGWKNPLQLSPEKDDSQSVSSLDLVKSKSVPSKEMSPSGGDSQSLSSVDLQASDKKDCAATEDMKSVSSLDLPASSNIVLDEVPPSGLDELVPEPDNPADFITDQEEPKPRSASELLTKGNLPNIGDRYSGLTDNPQDGERHTHCWGNCLDKCRDMIKEAYTSFSSASSNSVCLEIVESEEGKQYVQGVVLIYRVVRKIATAMKALSADNEVLTSKTKDIDGIWNNLVVLISASDAVPTDKALNFSGYMLKADMEGAQKKACGVCLLSISLAPQFHQSDCEPDDHNLTYGGRQYHTDCANFYVNCVGSTLPALKIPELL